MGPLTYLMPSHLLTCLMVDDGRSEAAPKFGARQLLVSPRVSDKFMSQYHPDLESATPGVRAQICVTDYNLDGKLDLIVGDYKDVFITKELPDDERQKLDSLIAREKETLDDLSAMRNELVKKYEELSKEEQKAAADKIQKFIEEAGFAEMATKRKRYCNSDGLVISNVWLYLRKSADRTDTMVTQRGQ